MSTLRPQDPDANKACEPSLSHRGLVIGAIVAKWVVLGGLVVFGSVTAVGTFGLDPFWSSLIGLALAFGIIVWHMPRKARS